MTRQRVLFLCTHNSARSQMAEGFLRALAGDRFEVFRRIRDQISTRIEGWLAERAR